MSDNRAVEAGVRFNEIIERLEREEKERKDILVPINSLRAREDFTFYSEDTGVINMTDHAFGQLCQNVYRYNLPAEYFKKIYTEDPQRFTEMMNYHLEGGKGVARKLRMQGNEVRGIVSEQYIPYDNLDAITLFMDTVKDLSNVELKNSTINDKVMFLRFTLPDTSRTLGKTIDGKDDKNFIAMDLINSEVGYTSIIVNPSIFRLVCTNGMLRKEAQYGSFKQRHIAFDPQVINDRFQKAVVSGVEKGTELLNRFESAQKIKLDNPYEIISNYGKRHRLSDKMIKSVRDSFDVEPDKTLYGVVNAFTRTARELPLERRLDLEKNASKIMDDGLKFLVA